MPFGEMSWAGEVAGLASESGEGLPAATRLQRLLDLARRTPAQAGELYLALLALATARTRIQLGQCEQALEDAVRAELLAIEAGEEALAVVARSVRGGASYRLGLPLAAIRDWLLAQTRARWAQEPLSSGHSLCALSWLLLEVDSVVRSRAFLELALSAAGSSPQELEPLCQLLMGCVSTEEGRIDAALAAFEHMSPSSCLEPLGLPVPLVYACWARAQALGGQTQRAEDMVSRALLALPSVQAGVARAQVRHACGQAYQALAEPLLAQEQHSAALTELGEAHRPLFRARLARDLARSLRLNGSSVHLELFQAAEQGLASVRALVESAVDEAQAVNQALENPDTAGLAARARLAERNAELRALASSLHQEVRETRVGLRGLTHDLRNSLTGIRLGAELALQGVHTPEERELLQDLLQAADGMGRILEAVRGGAAEERTDLAVVVLEVVREHRLRARLKSVAVQLEVLCSQAPIELPAVDASVMVANLLDNAIKFTPPRGVVCVRLTPGRLVVDDSGPGVPPQERQRIFEALARGSARPTGDESSTGMGLYVVANLAQRCAGSVRVEDGPQGGGRFVFTWP